jgi:hypothetical protein
LSNGIGTLAATLNALGQQTITATDSANAAITGASSGTLVGPAKFLVAGPQTSTAGVALTFTVTAVDAAGNTATGYAGAVHFTSSDSSATLPADMTLTNGTGTFSGTFYKAGNQTLAATDSSVVSSTGTSPAVAVAPGSATTLSVVFPSSETAGVLQAFTVAALDVYGNTATGYLGTVSFTSTDGQAGLPANYTFIASDAGTHTFAGLLRTAGVQSLSVTDAAAAAISGSENVTVTPAAASKFVVGGAPPPARGQSQSLKVTAKDPFGNTVTGYAGTVDFATTDSLADLPSSYTFVPADAGVHTFTVTLRSPGTQSITATDHATPSITGSYVAVPVPLLEQVAGALTHSTEYYHGLITRYYERYLGRGPDQTGLAYWTNALQSGLTDENLEAGFFWSKEYIDSHGGIGTALPTVAARTSWLTGLYVDLIGRQPDAAGLQYWLDQLAMGVTPESAADQFAGSAEREGQRVALDYSRFLARTPAQSEVNYWVNQFLNFHIRNEDVVAGFLASNEYFYQKQGANPRDWLFAVYHDLFNRAPDDAGLNYWLGVLG